MQGFKCFGTYVDFRRLSFNNGGLKENIFVYEAEILVKLGDGASEDPLLLTTTRSCGTLFHKCKDSLTYLFGLFDDNDILLSLCVEI